MTNELTNYKNSLINLLVVKERLVVRISNLFLKSLYFHDQF